MGGSALFGGLPEPIIGGLLAAGSDLRLPANHPLYRAGDAIRSVYFLMDGSIKRSASPAAGGEKLVELVGPGQVVGLAELFGSERFSADAETLRDCRVIDFDAGVFRAAVRESPELAIRIIETLAHRQCAIEFESVSQHTLTGTRRVLDYLIDQADGDLPLAGETTVRLGLSKKLVASHMGMAPETLSRTLRQLADSGAIVVDGRKLHIQNAILALRGAETEPKALRGLQRKTAPKAHMTAGSLINLCGRQRMLSQRMAIAWIMSQRQIAPLGARVALRQASAQFERNLRQLRTLTASEPLASAFARLNSAWPGYRDALMDREPSHGAPEVILDLSEAVLDAADRLTATAEQSFGTPEGARVNLAGRNRMLSQRLTKLYLFRTWGIKQDRVAAMMTAAAPEFAHNLETLHATADIDPALAEQLRIVGQLWLQFTALLYDSSKRSGSFSHVRAVLAANDRLLRHVDTTVKLYEYLAE